MTDVFRETREKEGGGEVLKLEIKQLFKKVKYGNYLLSSLSRISFLFHFNVVHCVYLLSIEAMFSKQSIGVVHVTGSNM